MNHWLTKLLISAGLLCTVMPAMSQALPYGLFDSHTHFYTDDFSHYPLHPEHAYMGVRGLIGIVLAHPNTPDTILPLWQANGVDGGVGIQYSAAYQTDNRYVLAVARQHPQQIVPVVILDTDAASAADELRTLARQDGVAGIRLTGAPGPGGSFPWLDSAATRKVWQAADDLRLVVIVFSPIHTPHSHEVAIEVMRKVRWLAQRYPHVRIVLDHGGWMKPAGAPDYGWTGIYLDLAKMKNIYFKITSINFIQLHAQNISSSQFMRHAVDVIGADHIMWGSDLGNTLVPYAQMVRSARDATVTLNDGERKKVLHDTACQLFTRIPGMADNKH